MLDEKTRALLGDKEAQKRFTERGELLPCPSGCKSGVLHSIDNCRTVYAVCPECGFRTSSYHHVKFAIMQWNNRAPIVTPWRIDFLGARKCCRTCEFSNGNEYGPDEPVDHLNCSFNDTGDIWVKPDDYCSYGYKERLEDM